MSQSLLALTETVEQLLAERPADAWNQCLEAIAPFRSNARVIGELETYGFGFESATDQHAFRRLVARALRALSPEQRVLAVVGGSGSGKSTLTGILLEKHPDVFVRLRRSTTRPRRQKDAGGDAHRFMSTGEFAKNEHHLYGQTTPYGFRYGFLLEDVIEAALSQRAWVVNVMVHLTDLKALCPGMQVRVVGITPLRVCGKLDDEGRRVITPMLRGRIISRDGNIQLAELDDRVQKACRDTELVHQVADQIIVNPASTSVETVYAAFEAYCLGVRWG